MHEQRCSDGKCSGFIWFVWETKRKGHTQAALMAVVCIACLEYNVKNDKRE